MRGFLTTCQPHAIYWHYATYLLVHHDELVTFWGDAPTLGVQATMLDHDWLPHSRLEPAALPPAGEMTGVWKKCSHKQSHEKYGLTYRGTEYHRGRRRRRGMEVSPVMAVHWPVSCVWVWPTVRAMMTAVWGANAATWLNYSSSHRSEKTNRFNILVMASEYRLLQTHHVYTHIKSVYPWSSSLMLRVMILAMHKPHIQLIHVSLLSCHRARQLYYKQGLPQPGNSVTAVVVTNTTK